jgi:NitT/TauT family transport system substrate-binding protein
MRGIAVLLGVSLIVVSCGGSTAQSTPTPSSATTAAASSTAVVLPKPEKTTITIGVSSVPVADNGPQIFARQLDLYGKYGLTVKFSAFNGAGPTMQALLAGQIDLADVSAAPVFATIGTDSETQIIVVARSNDNDILFTQKDIKTGADLKGKSVAISSFGSSSYAGTLSALKALNLTDKDVTLTTVGSSTARIAALKGGSVAGSVEHNTFEKSLNAAGFNSLVRLGDVKGLPGQPSIALVAPVDFQKKNPNTVLAVVAAWLEATQTFRTMSPDAAVPIMAKELTDVSPADLRDQIALVQQEPWTPKDGMCVPADIQFAKEIALTVNPSLANVDPLKACNNDYLVKLKGLGLQHQLGIPGY